MFFEGMSYDQIAHHAGVAKGSVEEIIRRLKSGEYEEYQDVHDIVDTLREIAIFVRKHFSGDLDRCHVGSLAWAALNRLGVDPAKVPEWARMCEDLAASDVPARKFAEIAIWSWRLQKEVGIPLLELPQYLESLEEKLKASLAEREAVESQVQAAKASLASLREETGLLQDIEGLRSATKREESRLLEAQSRARAALAAAEITSEGLEQFRVFAGTAKAKGVPLHGALFDTLLALVGSLGPQGIREVETLRGLLAKEGMNAAEGAALLTGLWRLGFTLSEAANVARALGDEESFPDALARLVSLLHEHGTLQTAVDASKQRLEELSKQVAAQLAESEKLNRHLDYLRNELSNLQGQVKAAGEQKERIRVEAEGEMRRLENMREAWFDEYADRFTEDDYVLLGTRMRKKNSPAQAPPTARWVWGLMTPQGSLLTKPRLAADGTPIREADGAVIQETVAVTLSRLERLRLRELLQRASLEGEGPLHAIGRITSGPPGAPPRKASGSTDDDSDLLLESLLRNQATLDFLEMMEGICEGRIGHFEVLPGRGETPPEGAGPAPKAPLDLMISGIMSVDHVVREALSPSDATPGEPAEPLPAQMRAAGRPTTRERHERPHLTSSARRRSRLPSKGSTRRAIKKTSTGDKRRATSPSAGKSRNTTTRRRRSVKR